MDSQKNNDLFGKNSMAIMSVGVLVVFIGLVFFLYMWVSNKNKNDVVFPAGINYTGNEKQPSTEAQAPAPVRPVYDYAKYINATNWETFNSPQKTFSFQHPTEMLPLVFPGDQNDMITFDVADVPVRYNIMALTEVISSRDKKFVGKPEQFVKNYWSFFGGLKGVSSVEPYENKAGLKGYKVVYANKDGGVTADNYFFVIPGQTDKMIHFTNIFPKTPAEAGQIFQKILDSVSTTLAEVPTKAAK